MISQLLSATLAFSPPTVRTPPDFESQIGHTEFVGGKDDAQLIAYDDAGEVLGIIAIWVEPDGRVILSSDYTDGYAETVVKNGRAQTEATLSPEVLSTRAQTMLDTLDSGELDPVEGKFECVAKTVIAAMTCAKFAPACPFAAYWAACECLPLVIEGFECPDW